MVRPGLVRDHSSSVLVLVLVAAASLSHREPGLRGRILGSPTLSEARRTVIR